MDEEKLNEIRKKMLINALKKSFEYFPIRYAMLCYDTILKTFNIVVKFDDKPSLHAADLHDYIYTRYGLDPRFYVVNTLNPMTRERMLKECEFVEGDREEYLRDLEEAEREAREFERNLKDVAKLYGVRGSE
ncbi:hypothetical protein [Ignicoccus hospitalis]|uniref:Uncharacterized protein n=1 Tax=Ignicoccus hospitalis (strain KIN4/I / DSM 18386 / JCM 14125) TaxID=453591 RepID=A8AAK6_IGNH4|nr:hypothetical protein [Ignicoccus hospitalis]ABU81958.1 hypothetical protein Igni_0776 [Ignicoccus hospitalis KIN4/I]HIH89883.1 hypothetical protein [Desulfurococcaceae archaeon]